MKAPLCYAGPGQAAAIFSIASYLGVAAAAIGTKKGPKIDIF